MEFIAIHSPEDFQSNEVYTAYCNAFPEDERRSEKQFQQLFSQEKSKILAIVEDLNFVGYLIIWELSKFVFLEHFEIFPEFRNKKLGTKVLNLLFQNYSKIILESEPKHLGEIAERRIHFYERNGFSVIDEEYIQPPYDINKNPLNLFLLSNFPLENLQILKEEIYDTVYHRSNE